MIFKCTAALPALAQQWQIYDNNWQLASAQLGKSEVEGLW